MYMLANYVYVCLSVCGKQGWGVMCHPWSHSLLLCNLNLFGKGSGVYTSEMIK